MVCTPCPKYCDNLACAVFIFSTVICMSVCVQNRPLQARLNICFKGLCECGGGCAIEF